MPAEVATPDAVSTGVEETSAGFVGRVRAMASEIVICAPRPPADREARDTPAPRSRELHGAVRSALEVFTEVQRICTRFDDSSPLMRANACPNAWHRVPPILYDALVEAHRAYERTSHRFDPRVITDLVGLGYDRSLPFESEAVDAVDPVIGSRMAPARWRPRFRRASRQVHLGGHPVELGGIGKGLAVRWAAQRLLEVTPDFLIEAGGDCHCAGRAPGGEGWRIGVEDPSGHSEPVAVLQLRDRACATSSVRVRKWRAGGRLIHHLIDPRTGQPGGRGLAAVTIVGEDTAIDEVWSKTLFLAGSSAIASEAERRGLAGLWVTDAGRVGISRAMRPHVLWERR